MNNRTIRAVLYLTTPQMKLKKNVDWFYYEVRASLEPSTTAKEAFDNFYANAKKIIHTSPRDLKWLKSIYFYEEVREFGRVVIKEHTTKLIVIGDNMEFQIV